MTAEEMEEFWAARSLDPYKEHRRKLADIKEQFYAAELDSTKLIEDMEQTNSNETKPKVTNYQFPPNNSIVSTKFWLLLNANGTAMSSQALKYLSKTWRKKRPKFH